MKKWLLLVTLALASLSTAQSTFKLRFPPNPPRYLKQIPLNEITERDLLDGLGIPQNRVQFEGEDRWQYEQVNQQSGARASWTYVLVNGVVVNVIYNASGCMQGNCPYNGMSARKEQGL